MNNAEIGIIHELSPTHFHQLSPTCSRSFTHPRSGSIRANRPAIQCLEGGLKMAYREVRMMYIDQVIRRWLADEKIRAIARSTGRTETRCGGSCA